jgi:hypothetical protein
MTMMMLGMMFWFVFMDSVAVVIMMVYRACNSNRSSQSGH